MNWLKFGGLVGVAFALGLLFAGLLDVPAASLAQTRKPVTIEAVPASNQVSHAAVTTSALPLAALSDAFANVAESVRPSVVYIVSRRTERQASRSAVPRGFEDFFGTPRNGRSQEPEVETGAGSGFLVSPDGYILTNNHVVDGADQVTVRLLDRHEFTAKVVGTDPNTDIAVIKIEPKRGVELKPAVLGSSSATRVGEWVLAVGNPLSESLSFTVTQGIISAKGRGQLRLPGLQTLSIQDYLQTDAAINRGNSGGPLLNVQGQVVGINSAIFSPTGVSAGYAFAIPIDLARQVMEQLITKGKVERAALGVLVRDATSEDAEYVGLEGIYGVKIDEFTDGSPARTAGLQSGDVVVSIDGERVDYTAQLQQLVGFKKAGSSVKVEVARKGGARKVYNVRLVAQGDPQELAARDDEPTSEPKSPPSVAKERLGITVDVIDAEAAARLNLPRSTQGILVTSVDPYGPADQLLVAESYPVITAVEGTAVKNEADLRAALRSARAGEVVSLTVLQPQQQGAPRTTVVRIKLN
ncbi:MAG: trypsin-like peptidase domain-containing protein [Gemmatimonadales bacterium]